MKRLRIEEDLHKDQLVVKDKTPICAVCGTELEMDDESREYICPVCDSEDQA